MADEEVTLKVNIVGDTSAFESSAQRAGQAAQGIAPTVTGPQPSPVPNYAAGQWQNPQTGRFTEAPAYLSMPGMVGWRGAGVGWGGTVGTLPPTLSGVINRPPPLASEYMGGFPYPGNSGFSAGAAQGSAEWYAKFQAAMASYGVGVDQRGNFAGGAGVGNTTGASAEQLSALHYLRGGIDSRVNTFAATAGQVATLRDIQAAAFGTTTGASPSQVAALHALRADPNVTMGATASQVSALRDIQAASYGVTTAASSEQVAAIRGLLSRAGGGPGAFENVAADTGLFGNPGAFSNVYMDGTGSRWRVAGGRGRRGGGGNGGDGEGEGGFFDSLFGGGNAKSALGRLVGGRPRGLYGLASLAGAGMVAGAASTAMRQGMRDIENADVGLDPAYLAWNTAERIPFVGGWAQLARMNFGDTVTRQSITGEASMLMRQGAHQEQLTAVRNSTRRHLDTIRQTTVGPQAEAAAAASFERGMAGGAAGTVTHLAIQGVQTAELGGRREAIIAAQAGIEGAQKAAALQEGTLADQAGRLRLLEHSAGEVQTGVLRNQELVRLREKDFSARGTQGIFNATSGPLGFGLGMLLAQGYETLHTGTDSGMRLAEAHGNVTAGKTNLANINLAIQSQQQEVADQQKRVGEANREIVNRKAQLDNANLAVTKLERHDLLRQQQDTLLQTAPTLMTMAPGQQQHWVDAVRRMRDGGYGATGPGDWNILLGVQASREPFIRMMAKEQDKIIPGDVQQFLFPKGAGGFVAAGDAADAMGADLKKARATIQAVLAENTKNIAEETALTISNVIGRMGDKIRENIEIRFGLEKQQRRDQAQADHGGGR